MGSEWQTYALTDLYSVSSGLSKPAKDFGEGHPFVSFKDVFYNFFLPDELSQLVKSSEKEQEKCSVRRGDVFLTRTSETMEDLGMSCVARKDYPNATFNGFSKRLRPSTELPIHPEYVGYYLRTPQFRNEMLAFSTMSTRASLNNDMIGRLQITLPPLPEQKAIAHILGTLDDKIELNRRMNATLEGIAQALFKSWFVDFDPVIDNALAAGNPIPDELAPRAEVRKNALANGTTQQGSVDHPTLSDPQSLFPAAFEYDDELGPIPEGWEVRPLAEEVQLTMGQSPSSDHYNTEGNGLPFHQGVTNYGTRFPKHEQFSTGGNRYAEDGNVLFSVRAPVGRINLADRKLIIGRGLAALRHKEDYQSFLVYFLKHTFATEDSIGSGTIFNAVNKKEMERIHLIVPPDETTGAFDDYANSLDKKIASNAEQTETLTKLRDTLLPKLISGTLRIAEGPPNN